MKKFLTILAVVIAACAMLLTFSSCNNRNTQITVDACWANSEQLTYNIYDNDRTPSPVIGSLTIDLNADLKSEDKVLSYNGEDRTYSSATVRIQESLKKDNDCEMAIEILTDDYTVLATNKVYTDLNTADGDGSYVLNSYHDGKNYVYTLKYADGTERSGKLNVGSSNYTDNEFLYYYVRCYDVGSVPSKTKIADPFEDKVYTLSCSNAGTANVRTDCPAGDTKVGGAVDCNKISISFASDPVGSSISAYYLPESTQFGYYYLKSSKLPVKMVENNLAYVLSGYSIDK